MQGLPTLIKQDRVFGVLDQWLRAQLQIGFDGAECGNVTLRVLALGWLCCVLWER